MADGSSPPGGPAQGLLARVADAARYVISGVSSTTWMSPMQPLAPMAPPEAKGRQWDYPVGRNLNYRPRADERIDFKRLRLMAENCDILRSVIQRQKELIEAFDWQVKPVEDKPGHRPGDGKFKNTIDEITALFRKPDHVHDWSQWLHMMLEEVFVIDALAIYRRPTLDRSRLWGLEIIAGDTITPLIDSSGRRPQPPSPAYQQVLKGVPAADFSLEELIYYPRSPRANRLYGTPPVQWIIGYVETAIERVKSQKAFFTEGNLVDTLLTGPETWTVDQIKDWQVYWDDQFGGNVQARRLGQWVPSGTKAEQMKDPALKDEFDEWLARVICFAYSTSPAPFIKAQNRSNQEGQQQVAEEGGIATYMRYIKRVMDTVIIEDLLQPSLEFTWSEDREFDPKVASDITDQKVRSGRLTLNEARDNDGEDPYEGDWADMPIIITATGVVPVENAIDQALNPPDPPPVAVAPGGGAPPPSPGGGGGGGGAKPAVPAPKPASTALKKRTFPHVPVETTAMGKARRGVAKATKAVLTKAASDVSGQVHRALLTLGKADGGEDDTADKVVDGLTLGELDALPEAIEDALADVAKSAGEAALVQVGVTDNADLVNQVAVRAEAWARNRAAELVGKKWTADGELVDNPNPKWAIDQSTRDFLRRDIADGLAANLDVQGIAAKIQNAYAFSNARADLIAHTEVRRANVQGSLEGAREARDSAKIAVRKVWLVGQEPCEVCLENEADGAIDLDDDFSSGDDGAPAHPKCYCTVAWDLD